MRVLRRLAARLAHSALSLGNRTIVRLDHPAVGDEYVHRAVCRTGIDLLVDVGANAGLTGIDFRRRGYRGRIVSFEPHPDVFAQLEKAAASDPLWECRCEGLGAEDAELTMEVSGFSPSSSFLPMRPEHVREWPDSKPVGTVKVSVRRLDGLADTLCVSGHRTFLKLDVQGYEAAVLAGAAETLKAVQIVYAELLFAPLYEGQARYYEIMSTLERVGLRFVGLFGPHYQADTGHVMYADGLFVRATA
jgi:FkbM family methyltransferase